MFPKKREVERKAMKLIREAGKEGVLQSELWKLLDARALHHPSHVIVERVSDYLVSPIHARIFSISLASTTAFAYLALTYSL